jgi:hypothetical protein
MCWIWYCKQQNKKLMGKILSILMKLLKWGNTERKISTLCLLRNMSDFCWCLFKFFRYHCYFALTLFVILKEILSFFLYHFVLYGSILAIFNTTNQDAVPFLLLLYFYHLPLLKKRISLRTFSVIKNYGTSLLYFRLQ